MTSFKRTTYSLILLFVVGFFCSFYAEAQRVRGKRQGGNPETAERMDSVQGDSLYADSLALADTTRKRRSLWMLLSSMRQQIQSSLRREVMLICLVMVR